MTLSPLISPAELANYLRRPTLDTDPALIEACDIGSGIVRDLAQQELSLHEDDTYTLLGGAGLYYPGILLPEHPVIGVSSVVVTASADSDPVTLDPASEYVWDSAGVLVPRTSGHFTGSVVVTYSHGFELLPPGLRAVVLTVAGRVYDNPTREASRTAGSHSESYSVSLTMDEEAVLGRYRH